MNNLKSVAFFSNHNINISLALNNLIEELIEYLVNNKNVNEFVLQPTKHIDRWCYKIINDYKQLFQKVCVTGIIGKDSNLEVYNLLYDNVKYTDKKNVNKQIIDMIDYCVFILKEQKSDDMLQEIYNYAYIKNKKVFVLLE